MIRETCRGFFLRSLAAGITLLVGANFAAAQVLIELPPPPTNASSVTPAQFNAIAFSLSSNFTNVGIEASLVTETTAGGTGTAFLTTAVGPGTTAADVVGSTVFPFTIVGDASTELGYVSLFSGLNLPADDYFLVFGEPISGAGGFISLSPNSNYVTDPDASVGDMMFAAGTNIDPVFAPASTFATSGLGNRFFRVTGVVPEPACSALACLVGLAFLTRRRS